MGLLTEGSPLSWEETKKLRDHVRKHGIQQFINLFARLKDRQGDGEFCLNSDAIILCFNINFSAQVG